MSGQRFVAALFLLILAASTSPAAITITGSTLASAQTTPGIANSNTYTLTAISSAGKIIGFNFDYSGASGFGIGGKMSQVSPFGVATVLNDTPDALYTAAGANVLQDSHFLVKSTDGIAVNAFETATALNGAFNFTNTAALGNSLQFAQIVTANLSPVLVKGEFTVETARGNVLESVNLIFPVSPEPASTVLAGLAMFGAVGLRRRAA